MTEKRLNEKKFRTYHSHDKKYAAEYRRGKL